jgi:ABC-2 type transport system ATP-binding protein
MRDGVIVATGTPATLGGRNRATGTIAFTLPDGVELDELAPGASLDDERRVVMSSGAPMADLHELTGRALALGLELSDIEVRRPTLEDVYLELTT